MPLLPVAAGQTIDAIQRETPANGATINIGLLDGELFLIIAPAGPIATLTLNWPTTPYPGAKVNIACTQNIASITHTGNGLNLSFTSMKATGSCSYEWDAAGAVFMCLGINQINALYGLPFNATVSGTGGQATFFPTSDATSTGTALFNSINFVQANLDAGNPNNSSQKPVVSNANRTVTINVNQQTFPGLSVLGLTVLGVPSTGAAPSGAAVSCFVFGTLA